MWLQEESCRNVVESAWTSLVSLSPESVHNKIQQCGASLLAWDSSHFGNISRELSKCRNFLEKLQSLAPTEENVTAMRVTENKISALLKKEETMWHQWSRISWMRDGDKNTSFFPQIASGRKKRNSIESILDGNGVCFNEEEDIARIFQDYFVDLFSSKTNLDIERVVDAVDHKVTTDMQDWLSRPFSKEETVLALSQMHPTKAPGPDEAFSSLIRKSEASGALHGIWVCRGAPKISHLFFADDNVIFGRANEREIEEVRSIIHAYEEASGQLISLEKSEVAFSRAVGAASAHSLAQKLGVNLVDNHSIYLGLPTCVGRSKTELFRGIVNRVGKKLKD